MKTIETFEELAKHLLENDVIYFRGDVSLHVYIRNNGSVKYFYSSKGEDSNDYAILKNLCNKHQITLPIEL